MSLTRDENHAYFWNGNRVPGVTEILQDVGLIDTRWFTDEGRDRGKYVHEACQYLLEEDLAWNESEGWFDVAEEYRPWVESCKLWIDAVRPSVVVLEQSRYSVPYGYAGQFDWLLNIDDRIWLIDAKSGSVPPWVGLQTAAYEHLLQPNLYIRRAALKLRKDGKQATLVPQKDPQDWDDFRSALGCFNAKQRLNGGWNGNG